MAFVRKMFYYTAMKGCGPDWIDVEVEAVLDDIEECTPQWEVDDMLKYEADLEMRNRGFVHFRLIEEEKEYSTF